MYNLVYEPLESLCRVPETKRHLNKLKQSEGSRDSSFGHIGGDHGDLVVGVDKIEF